MQFSYFGILKLCLICEISRMILSMMDMEHEGGERSRARDCGLF
jgi:hypothetical protein